MRKGDKELIFWLAAAIVLIVVALFLRRRAESTGAYGGFPLGGALGPYSSTVPGFPEPISIGGATINVNAQSPTFAWLSPYFPLFGFVGVDSTQIYQ